MPNLYRKQRFDYSAQRLLFRRRRFSLSFARPPSDIPNADEVVVGTPDLEADNRIVTSPDLQTGWVIAWGNIVGSGTVVVNSDGTFHADEGVTAFDAQVWDGSSWGAVATQYLGPDEVAPTVSSWTIAADGLSSALELSEACTFGVDGVSGLVLTPTNGGAAVTLSYASGDGTDTLTLSHSRAVSSTETFTRSHVQPGDGIQDLATPSNLLASFTGQSVTNSSTVNSAPTDIALSNSSVLTTGGLNAVVGTLSSTDPDPADTHAYTLVAGVGDTDNASFSISGASLRCDDPETLGSGSYSVRIQSEDSDANTRQEAFTINVVEPGTGSIYGFNSFNDFRVRF